MKSGKPETLEKFIELIDSGDVEVVASADSIREPGKVCYLVQDNRRTYEDGEIYEVTF